MASAVNRDGLAIVDNNMTMNSRGRSGTENTRTGGHVRCGARVHEPVAAATAEVMLLSAVWRPGGSEPGAPA
jgi:hypothetical protein